MYRNPISFIVIVGLDPTIQELRENY